MAPRAYWQGHRPRSLVSFSIRLSPALFPARKIAFHQIDKKNRLRVRQQLVVPDEGQVDRSDIVKSYEYQKDHYIGIDPEELAKLRLPSKHMIDIVPFVAIAEIDPIYYERPYFVVPDDKMALPAFATVREATKASRMAALGGIVFSGKEHLAAIRACGKARCQTRCAMLTRSRRPRRSSTRIDDVEIDEDQLEMAKMLINKNTAPLDMSKFNDSYEAAVKERVQAKMADTPLPKEEEAPRGNVVNLMDAVKRTLAADAPEDKLAWKEPTSEKPVAKPAPNRARP
ncbi:MAG: Ku protein [Rhodospirillales bacterium]|nr:Ku protein [Rhodospirillales bacterium]